MRFAHHYIGALLVVAEAALSGCVDLRPVQAQIDDLRLQVAQLQKETATATATANAAAANASVNGVQKIIRQVQSATQNNAKAITALSDKIDQMFKRPLTKQAAAEKQAYQ